MSSVKQFLVCIVVDTPNLVFRGGSLDVNALNRLVDFIKQNPSFKFIIAITPKLVYEVPFIEAIIKGTFKGTRNVEVFTTFEVMDPDEAILMMAMKKNAYVLSNDRFKQAKYDFFNKDRVIRYQETRNGLRIMS